MNQTHEKIYNKPRRNLNGYVLEPTNTNNSLLEEKAELEQKLLAAKNKLDGLDKSQKWIETQLSEEQDAKRSVQAKLEDLSKRAAFLESELLSERKASEKNRVAWQDKEKQLENDLKQARSNVNLVRRNTVSISARPRAGTARYNQSGYIPPTPQLNDAYAAYNNLPLPNSSAGFDDLHPARAMSEGVIPTDETSPLAAELIETKRLLREKEQKLSQIVPQLAELRDKLQVAEYHAERSNNTMNQYQSELNESRQIIETLRDDNESYQTLLQMQSMSGQFNLKSYGKNAEDSKFHSPEQIKKSITSFSNSNSNSNSNPHTTSPHIDALENIDLDFVSSQNAKISFGANLGAQLAGISNNEDQARINYETQTEILELKEETRVLKAERAKLQDENKALTLYITDILSRVLAMSGGMEVILDKDFNSKKIDNTKTGGGFQHTQPSSGRLTKFPDTASTEKDVAHADQPQNQIKTGLGSAATVDSQRDSSVAINGQTRDISDPRKDSSNETNDAKLSTYRPFKPIISMFGSSSQKQNPPEKDSLARSQTMVQQKKPQKQAQAESNASPGVQTRKSEELEKKEREDQKRTSRDKPVGSRPHSKTLHSGAGPTWWNRFSQRFSVYDKEAVVLGMPQPTPEFSVPLTSKQNSQLN